MTAEQQPELEARDQVDEFVAEWRQKYAEAVDAAREAAETTGTGSWQATYRENMKAHRRVVAANRHAIQEELASIDSNDTCEDGEKSIRDAVKALADERIRHRAWRDRAVQGYKTLAENCRSMLTAMRIEADRREHDAPLVARGMSQRVREATTDWPTVTWNDEAGTIEVLDPETGEVAGA